MGNRKKIGNITVHMGREHVVVVTNYMGNNASTDRASHAASREPNLEAAYSRKKGRSAKKKK